MNSSLVNKPKTKRGEKTLEKLLKSAEQSFSEIGFHSTSIVDITRGAGIGLGTYYVYFNDKLSIYKYLLLMYSHDIRKQIALALDGISDRKEAERVGLKTYLEFISTNKHIYNIIWESLYIDKTLFIDYYTGFGTRYGKQITRAQEEGQMNDFDPEVGSFMLIGIANFIGLNWIMFKDEKDFDYVVNQVIKILDVGMFAH